MRPDVEVTPAPPMVVDWDVPVRVRDGTVLRVNVFRPTDGKPVPVIMAAHPYGKDRIPARTRTGRGINPQYRMFPQPATVRISDMTNWEAPDPGWWVPNGYAFVNADLRGGGTSEGTAHLLSDAEADDYHDLIEWAGTQPWSDGAVGLCGVSYLAISQYKAAATRPPHLAAICPWEGFSDLYRDFARPGGGREDGFTIVWSKGTRRAARVAGDLRAEIVRRPQMDAWYRERMPALEQIEVPVLECASFSDHSLHSRGSFEAFRRAGSQRKWLTTHRGGKWSTFYSQAAKEEQLRFFDHVLKGMDNGWDRRPQVTVAVHDAGPEPVEVFGADSWPPSDLEWVTLHLDPATGRLHRDAPAPASASFRTGRRGTRLRFVWEFRSRVDVVGPMTAHLNVSLSGGDDAVIFAAVRKARGGREVAFEGSYGFGRDVVTRGWQRVAHRSIDPVLSTPWQPVHTHDRAEPVIPGELAGVEVALLPQATRFEAGDQLVLDLQGHWLFPRGPLRGQLPVGYQRGPSVTCTLHGGQQRPSTLLLGLRHVPDGT